MSGSVEFHASVDGLPAYVPGASGGSPGIFKLSSNEVPDPPAPAVITAIADAGADANRYPEMFGDTLVAALAGHHGLEKENILIGNGSVSLLELIIRSVAGAGEEVVYSWRSFEAYPILVQVTGAESVQVPNTPSGEHDLPAMARAVTERTKAVIVCTPNNPTGAALSHAQVAEFLAQIPPHVLVLLDEAYVHFDRSAEAVDSFALLREYKNLIVLRTFSKAYGLAGLRVGYAMGRPRLIAPLQSASTPFGVNALAQRAARAALESPEHMERAVAAVVDERTRVVGRLREQGWDVGDPQGNFYWLPIGDKSQAYASEALTHGFTARPFPEGVRVSIAEPEGNDLALGLAGKWAKELGL